MKKFYSLSLLVISALGSATIVADMTLEQRVEKLQKQVDELTKIVADMPMIQVVSSMGLAQSDAAKELQGQVQEEQKAFEKQMMQLQQQLQQKQVDLQNAVKSKMPQSVIEKHQEEIASLQRKGQNLQAETKEKMERKYQKLGQEHTMHIVKSAEAAANKKGVDVVMTEEGRILHATPKSEITKHVLEESNKLHKKEKAAAAAKAAKKAMPKSPAPAA